MSISLRRSLVALCLVAVTGCGSPDGESGPDADPSTPAPSGETTLEGTVRAGVETGCLVIRVDGTTYLLLGAGAEDLAGGERVRLVGMPRPDLATSCMQGVPFRVRTSEPLP